MDTSILRRIGLTDNEVKLYITLLKVGECTAYELSQKTGLYRVHVYDKLEQLMDKGLVTHVFKGAKKYFTPASPEKLKQYIDEKKKEWEHHQSELQNILPQLSAFMQAPKQDTRVEVFKGIEGLKYVLRDIVKFAKKEVLIFGIDDSKYEEAMPIYVKQHFRDLKKNKIKERVIAVKKRGIFLFDKETAPTTTYRFLEGNQFNPTNTMVYANTVVIVIWGTPITAIMLQNQGLSDTYRSHFEQLWNIASEK